MSVELIAAVSRQKNGDLGISHKFEIPWYLPEDLEHFRDTTMGSTVVMGRNTFESLPRPLRGRRNIVLTKNPDLEFEGAEMVCSFEAIELLVKQHSPDEKVFIIGGAALYQRFIDIADKIHLTEVQNYFECDNVIKGGVPGCYSLTNFSKTMKKGIVSYRFLEYSRPISKDTNEEKYLGLMKEILEFGSERVDRTGVGTISVLGKQLRFDISDGKFPILTTKQVGLKAIVEELLFFCRGDTDTSILNDKGVKIWNGNTTRQFLDDRGLTNYKQGIMGPMYGWSWRNFGESYDQSYADTSLFDVKNDFKGFDQLSHVEKLLKTDPFSRRIYISNLNPKESKNMCLEPCHTYIQFYVEEKDGQKFLSAYFTMRSSDTFLGGCFNWCSYSLLVYILALRCDMTPKEIIYNAVDCHIYKNHVEQVKKQLSRAPRASPKIVLNPELKTKDWSEMSLKDFELVGYMPCGILSAPMAV